MTLVSAQVSLYPLAQSDLGPAIQDVIDVFDERGLTYEVGPMSTLVVGDAPQVFSALEAAYERAARRGGAVLTVSLSNACPIDGGHGSLPNGE